MSAEIGKKEVAAVSAAIAAHLAKSHHAGNASSVAKTQKAFELLLERVAQLEKQVKALTTAVNEVKSKVAEMEK